MTTCAAFPLCDRRAGPRCERCHLELCDQHFGTDVYVCAPCLDEMAHYTHAESHQ